MPLQVRILGSLRVSVGDTTTLVNAPQLRTLLVALVLRAGTIVPKDELVDVLWRGQPTPSAAIALRGHVNQLRKLLEPDRPARSPSSVLLARAPGYVLTLKRHELDAHQFEDDVAAARSARARKDLDRATAALRRALGRWEGAPLRELDDLDLAAVAARRLTELRTAARIQLAEIELDRGNHVDLVPELQQYVAEDPLCERYSALLMLALYRCGRQGDALRAMAWIRDHLAEELGVDPGEELQRLEHAILDHDPHLADPLTGPAGGGTRTPPPASPAPAPDPPDRGLPAAGLPRSLLADPHELLARDREQADCLAAWEAALAGRMQVLVVEGHPGAGKSRLLAELAREVADRDAVVLHGRCDEDVRVPFQPFAEAIGDLLARLPSQHSEQLWARGGSALARILPAGTFVPSAPGAPPNGNGRPLSPDDAPGRAELERYRLLESVATFFLAVSQEAPALLVIDDLQWADAASLLLLRHLAHHLTDARMLVAASCRDDALTARHPVAGALVDAKRAGSLRRLPLGGLDEPAVGSLTRQAVPDLEEATAARVARTVHGLTEGNPFFTREMLAHLRDSATVTAVAAGEMTVESVGLPMEVQVVLGRRMARLGPDTLDLLRAAAVVAAEVDVDLLADVTGRSPAEVGDALDEAYEAGLLVEVPGTADTFTFNHALLRHALYGDLPPGRRARLHLRVGEAIEARTAGRPVALSDLARHFSRAGSSAAARALDYCEQAGGAALAAAAYEHAVAHYEDALRVTARSGGDLALRGRLQVALGRARMAAADPVGARAAYSQAAETAARAGLPALLGEAALGYGSEWSLLGPADEAFMVLLDRAVAVVDDDHARLRAYLLARRAMARYHRFGTARAERDCRDALAAARAAGDPGALAAARHVEHEIHRTAVAAEDRLAIARDVVALGRRAGDHSRVLTGLSDTIADLLELGRTDEAATTCAGYAAEAQRIRRPVNMWMAAALEASLAGLQGPMDRADRLVHAAFETGTDLHMDDALRVYAIQLFTVRWHQGRLAELDGLLRTFLDTAGAAVPAGQWLLPRAMIELVSGRHREARETFTGVLDNLSDLTEDSTWLGQMSLACELAWWLEEEAAAAALLVRLLPYRGRNIVIGPGVALFGPLDRALALVAARCGRAELAAGLITAAERGCEAMGSAPWLARCLRDHALVLGHAGGAPEQVGALLADAHRHAAPAGVHLVDL